MTTRLEDIQKSLDMYLETKKVIFPRFYFISNDDLLEILGQSKNPSAVQQHFKKLFDNVKSLKLQKASIGQKTEAAAMFSQESEEVSFTGPLTLEGPVEAWLCDVESTMRSTLKDLLRQCKASLKKHLNELRKMTPEALMEDRYKKFRAISVFTEEAEKKVELKEEAKEGEKA